MVKIFHFKESLEKNFILHYPKYTFFKNTTFFRKISHTFYLAKNFKRISLYYSKDTFLEKYTVWEKISHKFIASITFDEKRVIILLQKRFAT